MHIGKYTRELGNSEIEREREEEFKARKEGR